MTARIKKASENIYENLFAKIDKLSTMDNAKNRILYFLGEEKIPVRQFESAAGLSNGYMRQLRNTPSNDKLSAISAAYPQLNMDWVLTGNGEMLVEDMPQHGACRTGEVPFYDVETTGGATGLVASSMESPELIGYLSVGGLFGNCQEAAIRHVGASMAEYPDGCILILQQIHDFRSLVPGRNYVFETNESRFTKRYSPAKELDKLILYSTNSECYPDGNLVYPPFTVEKADIRRIFTILGYVVSQSCQIRFIN